MGDATDSGWERSDAAAHARALVQAAQARRGGEGDREVAERCHALGSLSQLLLAPAGSGAVAACWRELWTPLQNLCNDRLFAVAQAAALACGILAAAVSHTLPASRNEPSAATEHSGSSQRVENQPPWSPENLPFNNFPPPTGWGDTVLQAAPTGWGGDPLPTNNPPKAPNSRGRSSPRGLFKRGAREAAPPDPERMEERRWLAGFFQWARTLLSDGLQRTPPPGNARAAAALLALHEAFARGAAGALQLEAGKMLVAVQALLEDEETPIGLLSRLVHLVAALGKNFPGAFTGHQFVDIVDVLLGWALDPSLPEGLHHQMTQGAFLHFHASLWGESYQFAVNLLSKLVSDLGRLTNVPAKEGPAGGHVRTDGVSDGAGAEGSSKPSVLDVRADLEGKRTVDKEPAIADVRAKADLEDGRTVDTEPVVSDVPAKETDQTVKEESSSDPLNGDRTEKEKDPVALDTQRLLGDLKSDGVRRTGRSEKLESEPGGDAEGKATGLSERVPGSGMPEAREGGEESAFLESGTETRETRLDQADGQESVNEALARTTVGAERDNAEEKQLGGSSLEREGWQAGEEIGKSLARAGENRAGEPLDGLRDTKAHTDKKTAGEDVIFLEAEGIGAVRAKEAATSEAARTVAPSKDTVNPPVPTEQELSILSKEKAVTPEPTVSPEPKLTPEQTGHLLCLLRCFESVLEALTSSLFSSGRAKTLRPFARQWLPQILGCAKRVGSQLQDATWTRECCRSLAVLAEILGEGFAAFYSEALDYLLETLDHAAGHFEAAQVAAVLQVNQQLLASQRVSLPPSAVAVLLSSPALSRLRNHPHPAVVHAVVSTSLYLLQHDSADVAHTSLSVVHRKMRGGFEGVVGKGFRTRFAGNRDAESALALLNLDVELLTACAVRGLASRRSLSGDDQGAQAAPAEPPGKMPTAGPVDPTASDQPGLGDANLSRTGPPSSTQPEQTPCQRAVHILVAFFVEAEPLPQLREALFDALQTIRHAASEAGLRLQGLLAARLCALSFSRASSFDLKVKALSWVQQLLDTPEPSSASSVSVPPGGVKSLNPWCGSLGQTLFPALLAALSDPEEDVREKAAAILLSGLGAGLLTWQQTEELAQAAAWLKGDVSKRVAQVGSALLREAGLALWLDGNGGAAAKYGGALHQIAIAKQSRSFRPQQLALLLQYLGQTQHQTDPPLVDDWLQRLLHSLSPPPNTDLESLPPSHVEGVPPLEQESHEQGAGKVDSDWLQLASISHVAAQHWLVQEAARHCVSLKLRTHFGGPTQTFAAIEQLLKTAVAQLLAGNDEGKDLGHWKLAPMHFLLEFVDALERQIWGATHGSGILPPFAEEVGAFFAGNRKVVDEWFARLRGLLMQATSTLQDHSAATWHASLRLEGLRNAARALASQPDRKGADVWGRLQKDVTTAVRQLALSLTSAGEPDAVQGLGVWIKQAFPKQLWLGGSETGGGSAESPANNFGWLEIMRLQASGQYEASLAKSEEALNPQALQGLAVENARLLVERACAGYAAVTDWQGLQAWLAKVQGSKAANAGAPWTAGLSFAGLDLNPVLALGEFDEGDVDGAWSHLDRTSKENRRVTLHPRLAVQRGEQMLLQVMLGASGNEEKAREDLAAAKALLDDPESAAVTAGSLADRGQCLAQAECYRIVENALAGARELPATSVAILRDACQQGQHFDTFRPEWLKLLRAVRFGVKLGDTAARQSRSTSAAQPNISVSVLRAIHLQLVKLARMQGNVRLAERLLAQGPLRSQLSPQFEQTDPSLTLEHALVSHDLGRLNDAVAQLAELAGLSAGENALETGVPAGAANPPESTLTARACLKLAGWAQAPRTSPLVSERLAGAVSAGAGLGSEVSVEERALSRAIGIAPRFGKAWYRHAVWCDGASPGGEGLASKLTGEEREAVARLVRALEREGSGPEPNGDRSRLIEKIAAAMESPGGTTDRPASAEKGVRNLEPASWVLEGNLTREIQSLCSSEGVACGDEQLTAFISLWRVARARRLGRATGAIRGYSRFLSLSLSSPRGDDVSGKADDVISVAPVREDRALRALVRLLQLVGDHSAVLSGGIPQAAASGGVPEKGGDTHALGSGGVAEALGAVPGFAWQAVLPQLFALARRHPQAEVRGQVLGVLERVARELPWAVLYPVLADSSEEGAGPELASLRAILLEVAPAAVTDTEHMLGSSGLQRLLLLWSEVWLQLLTDLSHDVSKRLGTLHKEMQRTAANASLTSADRVRINRAKYAALMTPVAVLIERKLGNTSAKRGSAYDDVFRERFAPKLRTALAQLREPPAVLSEVDNTTFADVASLKAACWGSFASVAHELTSELQKHTLPLADLAPSLARITNSHVPLPGFESQTPSLIPTSPPQTTTFRNTASTLLSTETLEILTPGTEGVVTIAGLTADVAMLSTKTRPKRIGLVGSDGRRYHYLLKGREDLRLDAQIMQVLRACNSVLRSRRSSRVRDLSIRHYSVTPIGPKAGLIQWVPGLQSIYSCYKAWLQRQYALQAKAGRAAGQEVPPHPPRPSDLYYAKIMAGLKEKGLRRVTSRKEWPQDVKRKVLIELMKDTPRQLLAKELWLASSGAASAFERQQRYSRTAAVMSMVGHVLGLGDRHLDNILIDFATADVVHIDHNVAFDKGLKLRVPEVVPFRLTPIMQQALGLTGVEGTFRVACEETLAALRANTPSLLGLLEVFTWEPLAEWTAADGAALEREERQGMEVAVSLSLLASRLQEQQQAMQEHRDFLVSSVPALYSELVPFFSAHLAFRDAVNAATALQQTAQSLAGQGMMLELQLGGAQAATQKAESSLAESLQQMEALRAGVEAAAKESRQWWDQHETAVQGLKGSGPAKEQVASVLLAASHAPPPHTLTLLGALESTGLGASMLPQNLLLSCQAVDARTLQLSQARSSTLAEGVNALQGYRRALLELLPVDYAEGSAVWKCVQSMEKAVSGAGLADLAELLEGLVGLTEEQSEAAVPEYVPLRNGLAAVEDQLRKLVREVPAAEPLLSREREAFDQVSGWLGLESEETQQEEASFFGRFGSFEPPARRPIPPGKAQELRSAAHRATVSLADDLDALRQKTDVRLAAKALEALLDKCGALHRVVELAAPNQAAPGGTPSSAALCEALSSIHWGADAFERKLLPELSAALLKRDADVREALRAVRTMWADVSGLILAAEEAAERGARIAETERRLADMGVRLEGLRLVAQASETSARVSDFLGGQSGVVGEAPGLVNGEDGAILASLESVKGAFDENPLQESARQLSQESALESHQTDLGLSPGDRFLASQDAGFEHPQKGRERSPRGFPSQSREGVSDVGRPDEPMDAVREAKQARDALEKEIAALRKELEREKGRTDADGAAEILGAVRAAKERFTALLDKDSRGVVKRAAEELERLVGGSVASLRSASSGAFGSEDGDEIWNVPKNLTEEAAFVSQLGLLAAVAEACMLTSGPSVLTVQVETAGLQRLWEALGGLVMGQIFPAAMAALAEFAVKLEPGEKADVSGEVGSLLERYANAAVELGPVQRRTKELERNISVLERQAQGARVRVARLEWTYESILRRTVPTGQWEGRPALSRDGELGTGSLRWWQREPVLTALTRAVNALASLQEAATSMAAVGQQAEQELDSLVAFVGGDFTTVLRQKISERRQALWQAEQSGLAVNRLCKLVLEMEAARSVNAPSVLAALGLEQTGRVWVEGCLRLLTQFHGALSQHMTIAEALQNARAQHAAILDQANAHVAAVSQLRDQEQGLGAALGALGEELRQRVPGVTSAVGGFLEGAEKHSALTRGSEGVLGEMVAATEGTADESATVKARAEDAVAVQKELSEQVRQLQEDLNPLRTLLNPLVQTLPTLPAPSFDQFETSPALGPWVRLFLGEFLPISTKAAETVGQLAGELPENAEEVLESVLEVAETAAGHASAALQRAAGGAGDEVHGDALAQNAAPADTRIADELGEAAAIARASGLSGEGTGAPSEASVERARVSSKTIGGKSGARLVGTSGERVGAPSEAAGEKTGAQPASASEERAGILSGASGDQGELPGSVSQQGAIVQASSDRGVSPRSTQDKAVITTQERATTPNATQGKERTVEGQPGGRSGRGKERNKAGGKRSETGSKGSGFERNRHAIAVVETVRAKLEGRINAVIPSVPTSSRLLTVSEQVESLLRQATSIDNLANMYEGWTAWI